MYPDELTLKWGFLENPFSIFSIEGEARGLKFDARSFFVEPPYFQRIVGDPKRPLSTIIIGARGSGKSFIRNSLRDEIFNKGYKVLIIDYVDFYDDVFEVLDQEDVILDYHLNKIIYLCLVSLLKEFYLFHQ